MTPNDLRGRAAHPRGQDEELRMSLDAYEGRPFLNLRIWTRDPAGRGWWPS
ncbi:MAG: hypothetical protein JO034_10360, partial [Singulisphaera sp.]|nr:hypothetical protein [Singulisphaera sp.]